MSLSPNGIPFSPITRGLGAIVASGLLGVVLAVPAFAGPVEDTIAEVDGKSLALAERTRGLERDLGPGGIIGGNEAVTRFQDSMFQHLVGDHEPAAEGFFALVTTGALGDAGLHRDAEWYLAESLLGMKNYITAAERFRVVVNDSTHPFRADAVRRLLELYAESGDVEAFRQLYNDEIVSGRVKPTPQITYSLGRAFYRQGDRSTAAATFSQVPAGSVWHAKSTYYLGVMAVSEERLDEAVSYFEQTALLPVDSADGRRVQDLALLALGRIHYERDEFLAAAEEYNRIGGDSEYQADKLYEVIWTGIKQKRYAEALNNIEIFLLAFPEHRYSAQMMVNQGHLSVQERDWSGALVSYEQVIVDYEPVRSRFAALADPSIDSQASIDAVLDASRPELEGGLPAYAVAMMRADPELSRAMGVFQDLEQQRRDIEVSERLIQELTGVIQGGGGIGTLERVRFDAVSTKADVVSLRLTLIEGEEAYLIGTGPTGEASAAMLSKRRLELQSRLSDGLGAVSSYAARLASYESRLAALQTESSRIVQESQEAEDSVRELRRQLRENASLDTSARTQIESDVTAVESDMAASRVELQGLDEQVAALRVPSVMAELANAGFDVDAVHKDTETLARDAAAARPGQRDLTVDRFDGLHISLARLYDRLDGVLQSAISTETSEIGRIRQRFGEEVSEVSLQRSDYTAQAGEAHDVSLQLTREGFGRLEDFFADSVLKADMGIVDVYWAQKLEVADEIKRVKEEKDMLLTELQLRFKLIRQKIGE